MFRHHQETIDNITVKLKQRDDVLAVLVGGSIAHRFETETSDVDIMIVVSDDDYAKRSRSGSLHYHETESCTYEAGYIDGKYISPEFLRKIRKNGSEPARFAFEGAWATYSGIEELPALLQRIVRFPLERKQENMVRFYAQFEAWKWYCDEAFRSENRYLLSQSVSKFVLFAGRLILAHNEVLYPYHKWLLAVLQRTPDKPADLMDRIESLLHAPTAEQLSACYRCVKDFREWEGSTESWANVFIRDSELNWMYDSVPVDDV